MRPGRSLEVLVSHLEKVLSGGSVSVTSPMKLRDRFTGSLREHDIVLTINQGHHRLVLAIECRDHSRPIGVSQVEAFHTKCQDTGIDKGIIVSSKGFSRTAQTKAQQLGIRCFTLQGAIAFDWLQAPGLEVRKRRPTHLSIVIEVKGGQVAGPPERQRLVDPDGVPVSVEQLRADILEHFRLVPWDSDTSAGICELELKPDGLFVQDASLGEAVLVDRILCSLEYETIRTTAPFKLVEYSDREMGEKLAQAAIVDGEDHGLPGDIVVAYDPEKGGGVYLVKKPAKSRNRGEE